MSKEIILERSTANLSSKQLQIIAAALLGFAIIGVTVFAPLDVVHNATHDTRHNTGFPCH